MCGPHFFRQYSSLKIMGDRLLLKIDVADIPSSSSSTQKKVEVGEVVAFGEGRRELGFGVMLGNRVVYAKDSGLQVQWKGIDHIILKVEDVLGTLETEKITGLKPVNQKMLIKTDMVAAGDLLLKQASKDGYSIGKVIETGAGAPLSIRNTVVYPTCSGNDFQGNDGTMYRVINASDVTVDLSQLG